MKTLRWAAVLVLVGGFAACGGSDEDAAKASVMPDVVGRKLDVALNQIKSAGFEDDVDIEGGGAFGVVNESNWTVCEQSPAAGKSIADGPQLTVDRSCDDGSAEEAEEASTTTSSPQPEPEQPTLTASTNDDFKSLLALSDDCSDAIGTFASQYGGRNIEFDGTIGALNNHDDYETRYDILVRVGETIGPNFQFRDVGMSDLHFAGDVPESIRVGDNLHVVARVEEYIAGQCLLLLDPVSTGVR